MSVTLPTNVLRNPLARPETSSPAGAVGTQAAALDQVTPQPAAQQPTAAQLGLYQDTFEQASQALADWTAKYSGASSEQPDTSLEAPTLEASGDLPDPHQGLSAWEDSGGVVQQTKEKNCAPAAVAELAKSEGKYIEQPTGEMMDSLESRFTDGSGTTPHQMSNMLAHEGFEVVDGKAKVDAQSLDNAVLNDKKVMVQLDANKLEDGDAQQPGSAHWVTVDGKDAQGNYTVKDPSSGTKYSVDAQKLASAVDASWEKNGGGGMLVVDNAQGTKDEATLAQENDDHVETLGNTPGGGSRGKQTFGREV
ncbi:hypothetical protein [Stigmatella aurantiaca]|uniref:Conserved uncharacterized protein n=1 Tax=Stigmatella aurantiaca (strain DW4/3-1) TaxID=378806 RepID=Q099T9_STIAD|nr:hypothetical protein [Stigmatella aurantiaca]ADO73098.1 conserved uncharacterized protein [Stigmatella aurantiaca DW4/3-1]EAU68503.1 hypothetical protein STIAU_7399 [Stigmatella aurantiaca DW4/3-1]